MAITAVTNYDTVGGSTSPQSTGSHTPAAGTILYVPIAARLNSGMPAKPTVSDTQSLTWTERADWQYETSANPRWRVTLYTAVANGSATTVTATCSSCNALYINLTGIPGGAAPGANIGSNNNANGDPSFSLSSFAAGSAGFCGFIGSGTNNPTHPSGYAELDTEAGGLSCRFETYEDRTSPGTTFTWSSSNTYSIGWAVEVPEASTARTLTADAGSYSITGSTASLEYGREVAAAAGSYAVTGTAASLEYGREVAAAAGSYAITGTAASLRRTYTPLAAAAGSYTITGTAAALEYGYEVAAAAGSYTVTGTAAALEFGREVEASAGAYAITGSTASLLRSYTPLAALAGSYAVTGAAASLERGYPLTAAAGSYAITGSAASLEFGREVLAGAGSYLVTGSDAALVVSGSDPSLVAEAGAYAVTGSDISLEIGRLLTAAGGSYAVTGSAASLELGRKLSAEAGSYNLSGSDVTLVATAPKLLDAEAGSYLITGTAANLNHAVVSDEMDMHDGIDFKPWTEKRRPPINLRETAHTLEAKPGSYAITGGRAELGVQLSLFDKPTFGPVALAEPEYDPTDDDDDLFWLIMSLEDAEDAA